MTTMQLRRWWPQALCALCGAGAVVGVDVLRAPPGRVDLDVSSTIFGGPGAPATILPDTGATTPRDTSLPIGSTVSAAPPSAFEAPSTACVQVCLVRRGDGAVAEVLRVLQDVVLLDVSLPRASDFTIGRGVRERMDVPVILVTARIDEADRVMGGRAKPTTGSDRACNECRGSGTSGRFTGERTRSSTDRWMCTSPGYERSGSMTPRYPKRLETVRGIGQVHARENTAR